jgi:hypothetical protein
MILREVNMQHFVGLDVSQEITPRCTVGSDGKEWDY